MAVSREHELVQEQVDALRVAETDSSDLVTAVEDENPAERLQVTARSARGSAPGSSQSGPGASGR